MRIELRVHAAGPCFAGIIGCPKVCTLAEEEAFWSIPQALELLQQFTTMPAAIADVCRAHRPKAPEKLLT